MPYTILSALFIFIHLVFIIKLNRMAKLSGKTGICACFPVGLTWYSGSRVYCLVINKLDCLARVAWQDWEGLWMLNRRVWIFGRQGGSVEGFWWVYWLTWSRLSLNVQVIFFIKRLQVRNEANGLVHMTCMHEHTATFLEMESDVLVTGWRKERIESLDLWVDATIKFKDS